MDSVAVMEMRFDGGRPAPSSGWFVQERSTNPIKEASPAVGSGNAYFTKAAAAAAAEAGAANKAAATAMAWAAIEAANKKQAELAKAEPARSEKKTKMVMVRVQQEYIDFLLKNPLKPFPGETSELEKNIRNPEIREQVRIALAPAAALVKADRDREAAIVEQYLARGFAEEKVEVDDDEEV